MMLSIVVDYYRSRDLGRVAAESGSQALEADALHFSTDIASSAVVIVGLLAVLVARETGLAWLGLADTVAACVVAVIVLLLSFRLGRRSVDVLMDRAPSGLTTRVRGALSDLDGVQAPPRVRVRQAGDRVFADVELRLRPGVPVAEGDRVASEARSRVRQIAGSEASVLVQLRADPDEAATLRARVSSAVAREGEVAHNITLRQADRGAQADLHLELPGKLTLADAHAVADRIERRILEQVPELDRVDIHLELHDEGPAPVDPLERDQESAVVRRIREVAERVVGPGSVHDLLLTRTPVGIYLSCHCFLPGETLLEEAHALTDRLEEALRTALPDLARVAVHAEPAGHHRSD
jgi:divalent metal cation (Fe/Co/Zn/Cd) transporter